MQRRARPHRPAGFHNCKLRSPAGVRFLLQSRRSSLLVCGTNGLEWMCGPGTVSTCSLRGGRAMTGKPDPYSVAPNSVYVWRGFKAAGAAYADFAKFLGSVFVPACALLQPSVGLRAYLPTMVPQAGKPAAVPDQTALMFWATPQSHDLAAQAIAVRIYQNLHGDAYDMVRSKLPEVPIAFPTTAPI